jgi:SAM-dependent methyltransferase
MTENKDAEPIEYVPRWEVNNLDECSFYHVMDLPGVGTIGNTWDLRKTIHDYLGRFDFTGKRVLDVGSASGFLTFEMERRGASVVSFDIQAGSEWNYVPYASPAFDVKELTERLEWDIRRIKRAYWYAHRALQSRASVYYGNIYDIPAALGAFDVVNFGMVLPHLRDPFLAMQSAARLSRRWVIITQQSMQTAEPVMRFIPDAATCADPLTWWAISEGCTESMLKVLGFDVVSKIRAKHHCLIRRHDEVCTAFVARRVHETSGDRSA